MVVFPNEVEGNTAYISENLDYSIKMASFVEIL